jgi:hypothetical protein
MQELIETHIETPDGIADCRLELYYDGKAYYYNATILYPNTRNNFSRSEVFSHDMFADAAGTYQFNPMDENIHPKIKQLEERLAEVINSSI